MHIDRTLLSIKIFRFHMCGMNSFNNIILKVAYIYNFTYVTYYFPFTGLKNFVDCCLFSIIWSYCALASASSWCWPCSLLLGLLFFFLSWVVFHQEESLEKPGVRMYINTNSYVCVCKAVHIYVYKSTYKKNYTVSLVAVT